MLLAARVQRPGTLHRAASITRIIQAKVLITAGLRNPVYRFWAFINYSRNLSVSDHANWRGTLGFRVLFGHLSICLHQSLFESDDLTAERDIHSTRSWRSSKKASVIL